ncbi:hypothetical protein [Knoellia aerolata]|uniref:Uncharacterized protein n=1 Tax=Knoellia aerolata DSM 18566 TaxID=1385519 RepID=A0A0A0JWP2_9MICO|nr:hypothetical protein [Knoellia aerolata]KGN41865.1 hypothetical protein N801_04065 [Knoellia aerolata DSM 18566]
MTIAGHEIDLARRGLVEVVLSLAVVVLLVLAHGLWRLGDRLSA